MSGWRGDPGVRLQRPPMSPVVKAIIIVTVSVSLGSALLSHAGIGIAGLGVLQAEAVLRGQVWRLVTWQLFEMDPINLLFACLMLYWFGSDLSRRWGSRRFVATYLGMAAAIGAVTMLVGRFILPSAWSWPYSGGWPLADALTIAWATTWPDRQIYLFFVARVGGRSLVLLTVGLTVLFAIFQGITPYVPHLSAIALALLTMGSWQQSLRRLSVRRRHKQARRYLKAVEETDRAEDEHPPPKKWVN